MYPVAFIFANDLWNKQIAALYVILTYKDIQV